MFKKLIFFSLIFLCWQINICAMDRSNDQPLEINEAIKQCQICDNGVITKEAFEGYRYCRSCRQRYTLNLGSPTSDSSYLKKEYGIPAVIILALIGWRHKDQILKLMGKKV